MNRGLKPPFNVFEICSTLKRTDIRTCPFTTKGLRGMATIASSPTDINCILVNSNLTFAEQNFHGIHEFIHTVSCPENSGQTFSCFDTVRPHQNSYVEWMANEGAAELLVPYKQLLPLIKKHYPDLIKDLGTYEFCEEHAGLFLVSPTVLQNRIDSLKYEIHQHISGIEVEDIQILSKKAQENKGVFVKSLVDLENDRVSEWFSNFKAPVLSSQELNK